MRRENYELRRANEILKSASVDFAKELDADPTEVSRYLDAHRGRFGVEPICRVLDVSASAYYQRATGERSARAVEDERLLGRIRAVHAANYEAYGHRRTWKALQRARERVPRCQVQRLMPLPARVRDRRMGRLVQHGPAARVPCALTPTCQVAVQLENDISASCGTRTAVSSDGRD